MNQYGAFFERADRDTDIKTRYQTGQSASQIAAACKVSAERVRQILRNAGLWQIKRKS